MDIIIKEVFGAMVLVFNKQTMPIDLVKNGVELLQNKPISNVEKKAILKQILTMVALGDDGIKGTFDDRLSDKTLEVLLVMVDSELIDFVIAGIVAVSKKEGFKSVFNRCGVCIQWKKKI